MSDSEPQKLKVLLVDDDKLARLSLRTVLLRLNLDVTEAARSDEALAAVEANLGEFAVAVLDVKLAGTSGLDLLRDIKQRDPAIEAVMVTGFETVEAAKRALRNGACDFINKPFDVPALTAAVTRAIKLHESTRIAINREKELRHMLEDMGAQGIEWVRIQRGIVHDVRNMLCVVRSYHYHVNTVLSVHRQLGQEETDTIKKEIGVIGRQLDTIVAVLDRQSNVWRKHGERDRANVSAVVEDLVMLIQRHPDARRAEISVKLQSHDLRALTSASDLAEMVLNILLNASQSTAGRVNITIEAGQETAPICDLNDVRGFAAIRVLAETQFAAGSDVVRVRIRDSGGGIPNDVLARIGKEQVSTKGARGTGLGLGVVIETVARTRGTFVLRSTVNHGTEAELILPSGQP